MEETAGSLVEDTAGSVVPRRRLSAATMEYCCQFAVMWAAFGLKQHLQTNGTDLEGTSVALDLVLG